MARHIDDFEVGDMQRAMAAVNVLVEFAEENGIAPPDDSKSKMFQGWVAVMKIAASARDGGRLIPGRRFTQTERTRATYQVVAEVVPECLVPPNFGLRAFEFVGKEYSRVLRRCRG